MIAHRFKTAEHADQIRVTDHGRFDQQSTHAQLKQQAGIYRSFVGERRKSASWKIHETAAFLV
ncbi:MAG: hypothetical protein IJ246_06445 [Clostridia bacterium]|nr:hypothetical protein [Clostridia bacterium]